MISKEKLRRQIIGRLNRMRMEIAQVIIDKESWADNRTAEMPFDVGWERCMLQCVEKQLEAWAVDDIATANQWAGKMHAMAEKAPEVGE